MADLLFVYGTLRSRFENDWARALRREGTLLGKASVTGSIFLEGGFPSWRPEPAGMVLGEVFEVPEPLFATLDDYEGELFARVPVLLTDGREAWIYRYSPEPDPACRIESGEFGGE